MGQIKRAMIYYQLLSRPAGTDTTPGAEGRVLSNENLFPFRQPFGSVAYPEPLAPEVVRHFSLLPYTEIMAFDGRVFQETDTDSGYIAFIRLTVMITPAEGFQLMRTHHVHFQQQNEDSFSETIPQSVADFYGFLSAIKSKVYCEVDGEIDGGTSPFLTQLITFNK